MGGDWIRNRRRERIVYLPVGDAGGGGGSALPIRVSSIQFSTGTAILFSAFSVVSGDPINVTVPRGNSLTVVTPEENRYRVSNYYNRETSTFPVTVYGGIYLLKPHTSSSNGEFVQFFDENGTLIFSFNGDSVDTFFSRSNFLFVV